VTVASVPPEAARGAVLLECFVRSNRKAKLDARLQKLLKGNMRA